MRVPSQRRYLLLSVLLTALLIPTHSNATLTSSTGSNSAARQPNAANPARDDPFHYDPNVNYWALLQANPNRDEVELSKRQVDNTGGGTVPTAQPPPGGFSQNDILAALGGDEPVDPGMGAGGAPTGGAPTGGAPTGGGTFSPSPVTDPLASGGGTFSPSPTQQPGAASPNYGPPGYFGDPYYTPPSPVGPYNANYNGFTGPGIDGFAYNGVPPTTGGQVYSAIGQGQLGSNFGAVPVPGTGVYGYTPLVGPTPLPPGYVPPTDKYPSSGFNPGYGGPGQPPYYDPYKGGFGPPGQPLPPNYPPPGNGGKPECDSGTFACSGKGFVLCEFNTWVFRSCPTIDFCYAKDNALFCGPLMVVSRSGKLQPPVLGLPGGPQIPGLPGGQCKEGTTQCLGKGYNACQGGTWVYRDCAPGTECRTYGEQCFCDSPHTQLISGYPQTSLGGTYPQTSLGSTYPQSSLSGTYPSTNTGAVGSTPFTAIGSTGGTLAPTTVSTPPPASPPPALSGAGMDTTTATQCVTGTMTCSGDGFNTCDNGVWVYRSCGQNGKCRMEGSQLYCDVPGPSAAPPPAAAPAAQPSFIMPGGSSQTMVIIPPPPPPPMIIMSGGGGGFSFGGGGLMLGGASGITTAPAPAPVVQSGGGASLTMPVTTTPVLMSPSGSVSTPPPSAPTVLPGPISSPGGSSGGGNSGLGSGTTPPFSTGNLGTISPPPAATQDPLLLPSSSFPSTSPTTPTSPVTSTQPTFVDDTSQFQATPAIPPPSASTNAGTTGPFGALSVGGVPRSGGFNTMAGPKGAPGGVL